MLTALPPCISEQGFVLCLYTRFKAEQCFVSGILWSEQQDNELDPKTGTGITSELLNGDGPFPSCKMTTRLKSNWTASTSIKSSDKFWLKYLPLTKYIKLHNFYIHIYNVLKQNLKFISLGTLSLKAAMDNAGVRWEKKSSWITFFTFLLYTEF